MQPTDPSKLRNQFLPSSSAPSSPLQQLVPKKHKKKRARTVFLLGPPTLDRIDLSAKDEDDDQALPVNVPKWRVLHKNPKRLRSGFTQSGAPDPDPAPTPMLNPKDYSYYAATQASLEDSYANDTFADGGGAGPDETTFTGDDNDKPISPHGLKFADDPVAYVKEKVDLFITIAKSDPIEAVKFVPEVAGGIGAIVLTIVALLALVISSGSSAAPAAKKVAKDVKDKAKDVKDKVAEAATTGAETAKAELNKRSTRSQQ